jgi:hypothetical protein
MHRITRRLAPSRILKRPRRARNVVALAIGLAAVPTVALAATDAVPGDPLKLGQENKLADATTTLTGTDSANNTLNGVLRVRRESGIGAALKVENTTPGAIGGQGIAIQVAPGKKPIEVVNPSDAGKTNLNVDKLDGRDQQDFLNASRVYKVGSALEQGPGGGGELDMFVFCDKGDIAIGAGGLPRDHNDDINTIAPHFTAYAVTFQDNGDASNFTAEVLCSDNAQPFRG